MNFTSPTKVLDTINAGNEVSRIRSENRARVDKAANGFPPLTDSQAKQLKIKINVEWGELARLLQQARRQYEEAILTPSNYFRVRIPKAPKDNQQHWEETITYWINRPMKRSDDYSSVKEDQILSLVSHGIGPEIWHTRDRWCPDTVAIEDLRVETGTYTSLKNLEWFAIRWMPTCGELARKVFGVHAVPYWNKSAIRKILDSMERLNFQTDNDNWIDHPERKWETYKQNLGYFTSDAAPTVPLWNFYFKETDPKEDFWKKVVVPDTDMSSVAQVDPEKFLYDAGNEPCAKELGQLLHIQFGDLSNKSPRMYHSVRALGYKLFEPCFWMNLARSRGLQHLMENFNVWLRVVDPVGRARAQKVELFDKAILEEGVSIVPANERHQIQEGFMVAMMAQLRQLMGEESAAYTQDIDTGTNKEQTATETLAKVHQANSQMSGLLSRWFRKEISAYREICRRFCLQNTNDEDVLEFRRQCKQAQIPSQWLDVKYWDIEPEIPTGAGHPSVQLHEAQLLMSVRPMHDAAAQDEILHIYDEAVLRNPSMAQRLAPLGGRKTMTSGTEWAVVVFPLLMEGLPAPRKDGVSRTDEIKALLGMVSAKLLTFRVPALLTAPALAGLSRVIEYLGQRIAELGQDMSMEQQAGEFSKELAGLTQDLQVYAAQFAKTQPPNGQPDPETVAKIQSMTATTDAKMRSKQVSDAQKLQQKDRAFSAEQRRKDAQTYAEIERQTAKTESEIENAKAKTDSQAKTE